MSEEQEVKFSFSFDFQRKIIKLMLTNANFFIKCSKYLKPHYFYGEILPYIYKLMVDYYDKYDKMITKDAFIEELKAIRDKTTNILEYTSTLNDIYNHTVIEEEQYLIDKVQEFVKRTIFVGAFQKTQNIYMNGKFDSAVDYMMEEMENINKVTFDPPDRSFFFDEYEERVLKREMRNTQTVFKIPSGIVELDDAIGGGPAKGELCIVVADAKVGKSVCLINVGASCVRMMCGKVLHINLEGREMQVEDRYEARLLSVDYNSIRSNNVPDYARQQYEMFKGSLVIRNMTTGWDYTVLDIEDEITNLKAEGFVPDVVIVDYGDLLNPRHAKTDSTYLNQQDAFRDLKTLAIKHNCIVWTAAQTTRAPPGKFPTTDPNFFWTRNNLADCYAKVRIADLLMTLNMTDQEKMSNRLRLYLDAYRDAQCGKYWTINTDYSKMKFYDLH